MTLFLDFQELAALKWEWFLDQIQEIKVSYKNEMSMYWMVGINLHHPTSHIPGSWLNLNKFVNTCFFDLIELIGTTLGLNRYSFPRKTGRFCEYTVSYLVDAELACALISTRNSIALETDYVHCVFINNKTPPLDFYPQT